MKLIIQIPCLNEAESIAHTLCQLPRKLEGFDSVEWLIIDDGSRDETVKIAKENGANHIISHPRNLGLAQAFTTGIHACLDLGADIIVNTDADNQYDASSIPDLLKPILDGRAEMVIGARPIQTLDDHSYSKKCLQRLGSWVVRMASNTDIPDATSGFRAFSRNSAMRLFLFNEYTYTLESIIQAGQMKLIIASVPILTNKVTRSSRLMTNIPSYIRKCTGTIIRSFIIYRPFLFFGKLGILLIGLGSFLGLRFLWFFKTGRGNGHVQSLILCSVLLGLGFQTFLVAFIADLLAANRKILEDLRLTAYRHDSLTAANRRVMHND